MDISLNDIASLISALVAFASLVMTILLRAQVNEVHHTFNSKMDDFISEIRKSERAEGKLEGAAEAAEQET